MPTMLGMPKTLTPNQRLIAALQRGATPATAAHIAGVAQFQAELMVDHLTRSGLMSQAGQQGACDNGACHPGVTLSDEQKIHCAGCPCAL